MEQRDSVLDQQVEVILDNIMLTLATDKLKQVSDAETHICKLLSLPDSEAIGTRIAALGARIRTLREDAAFLLNTDPMLLEHD